MKKHAYFIAPLAVAGLTLLLYAAGGVWPFGDKTIAWCDMKQQVLPFLLELKDVLEGKANLLFSMQNAGGMNYWGVFLFFSASPFSFLVAFVDKGDIWYFANVLVMLKMMVCAGTAALMFQRFFPHLGWLRQSALSVAYAFCGYSMMFYQNVVWLDMMYLFPLLLLALRALAEGMRVAPYVTVLTAMLVVNFYLSYMVFLFIIAAAGLWLWMRPTGRDTKGAVLRLGLGTGLSLLLSGVVWLPALLQYLDSARGGGNLFDNLSSGDFFTHFYTTIPFLLCTLALFAALPFAGTAAMRPRGRFVLVLFGLLLLPVLIDPINKMWHTGSYQAFPVRYGYMTVLLGLMLLAFCLSEPEERPTPTRLPAAAALGVGFFLSVVIGLWLVLTHLEELDGYAHGLWGNKESFVYSLPFLIPMLAVWLGALVCRKRRLVGRGCFTALLCLLIAAESLFNGAVYMISPANVPVTELAIADLAGRIRREDDTLYRVKAYRKRFDVNLIGALGYPTMSHYTSLTRKDYMYAMKKLGYSSYWMEVGSNGGTQFSDALLGNEYIIVPQDWIKPSDELIYKNDRFGLVKSRLSLPLATVVGLEDVQGLRSLPELSRTELQKYLARTLCGDDTGLFEEYRPTEMLGGELRSAAESVEAVRDRGFKTAVFVYDIQVQGRKALYFDCFGSLSNRLREAYNGAVDITINGVTAEKNYPKQSNNGMLHLGTFRDETVRVEVILKKDVEVTSFGVTGLDVDRAAELLGSIRPARLTQPGGLSLQATATAGNDDWLLLAVSYDEGFTATVNGKPAEIYPVYDVFMAVKLQEGENRVELRFLPQGFTVGAALTAAGVAACLLLWLLLRRRGWKSLAVLEAPARLLFMALAGLVLLAVFVMPVIVYVAY